MKNKEFINQPVPLEYRRSFWALLPVWIGFILVVGVMSIGSGLASGMNKNEAINAILMGNFLLGIFAAISGFIGAKSGKNFPLLISEVFDKKSAKIVSLYAPITLIGWYAVQASIFGNLIGEIFNIEGIARNWMTLVFALLFSVTCYFGFRALTVVSFFLVPVIILLGLSSLWLVGNNETLQFGFGQEEISFETGFSLVVGSWVLGVIASLPDISRFSHTAISGAILGFVGIFIFNSIGISIGLIGAAFVQQSDPALILLTLGAPIFSLVLGIANIWTTNDNNLYSASIGISFSTGISRETAVILCAFIGASLAFFNPSQFDIFFKFLFFLGNTAPALGGLY